MRPFVRESLFRKAIAQCPKDARAYYLLGRHYQALHLRSKASQAYQSALERLPEATDILRQIGRLDPRRPKEAIWSVIGNLIPPKERGESGNPESRSLQNLLGKMSSDPEDRLTLAKELTSLAESRMRRNQSSLPLLLRAIELVPTYERARNFVLQRFWDKGEYLFHGEWYDKAAKEYQEALIYAPNDPRLHLRLADTYSRMKGAESDALRHYRQADTFFAQRRTSVIPGDDQVSIRQKIQWGLDKFDENRPAYRKKRGDKARKRGKTYLDKADYKRAAVAFKKAIGWMPGDALLHFDLATTLKQLEDPRSDREALQHYERSLALFRTSPPPEAANLKKRFEKRIQLEIAHLTGESSSMYYLMQQVALGVQERAVELSLFVLAFAGITVYLLRAGMRISSPRAEGPLSHPIVRQPTILTSESASLTTQQ